MYFCDAFDNIVTIHLKLAYLILFFLKLITKYVFPTIFFLFSLNIIVFIKILSSIINGTTLMIIIIIIIIIIVVLYIDFFDRLKLILFPIIEVFKLVKCSQVLLLDKYR